jgi:hypothetical protein
MVLDVPHVKGTIQFGNGLGGGIQDADAGDVCVSQPKRPRRRSAA